MQRSTYERVSLEIRASDGATEIFLIDANLARIASGVGRLQTAVTPGLYKVRYRSGNAQKDDFLTIREGQGDVVIAAPTVDFRTSAPIQRTRTADDLQSARAQQHSLEVHKNVGHGGSAFIFAREDDETEPWEGCDISLHDLDGGSVAELGDGVLDPAAHIGALNADLDPGTYALRVRSGEMGAYEIFITVAHGWQTQVFLTFEDFWKSDERMRAPSLRTASLLMARMGEGFDPAREIARMAELARQALAQGRDIVTQPLIDMLLEEKYEDPVLGIVGGHLLLQRSKRDFRLLAIVCKNLRNLLGEHPDVQGLEVALGDHANHHVESLTAPPSLRRSWEEISKWTRRRAALVPSGSPLARISANVVKSGPWLMRRVPPVKQRVQPRTPSIAGAYRLAEQLVGSNPEVVAQKAAEIIDTDRNDLSALEQTVLTNFISLGRRASSMAQISPELTVDPEQEIKSLLSSIKAPAYAVANAVVTVAEKLNLAESKA